ncbi:MAG: N-acetylmuramoyl-L-alanine amidase [Bacillota bacterium]|nr:N-acetylmuramoyl-L-alanine amidase [Bacillota bacterium]
MRYVRIFVILVFVLFFLTVLSQEYQLKLSHSQNGWGMIVDKKQAKMDTQENSPKPVTVTNKIKATVGVNSLNVREEPSLSSTIVGKLNAGTKITINEERAGWAKVEASNGEMGGWVNTTYISKETANNNNTQPVSGTTTSKESIQNNLESLKGKTIVLDPGHGGNDDGTTSMVGTYEKTLTLATAQVVEQKLKNAGANVIMTRTNDTYIPLGQRAELSNKNHADAFISFHYNCYNDPSIKGLTDFYYQHSKDSALAADILNEVVKTTGLNNDGTKFDDLDVLRNNKQPSTLIELGYLSNKQDDSIVENTAYRDQVAQGVYLGLLNYFSSQKHGT